MKLSGSFDFKNKNNKPKKYHKVRKDKKTGNVVLEVTKSFYADYCEKCMKQKKK